MACNAPRTKRELMRRFLCLNSIYLGAVYLNTFQVPSTCMGSPSTRPPCLLSRPRETGRVKTRRRARCLRTLNRIGSIPWTCLSTSSIHPPLCTAAFPWCWDTEREWRRECSGSTPPRLSSMSRKVFVYEMEKDERMVLVLVLWASSSFLMCWGNGYRFPPSHERKSTKDMSRE